MTSAEDIRLEAGLRRCNILNSIAEYNTEKYDRLDFNKYCEGRGMDAFRKRLFKGIIKSCNTEYGRYVILQYWGADGVNYELFSHKECGGEAQAMEQCKALQKKMVPIIKQMLINEMS